MKLYAHIKHIEDAILLTDVTKRIWNATSNVVTLYISDDDISTPASRLAEITADLIKMHPGKDVFISASVQEDHR